MRRTHDMGGLEAGEIELAPHDVAPWQKQAWAMRVVLGDEKRKLVRVDELRRAIEDLDPADYHRLGYFDRWVMAMRRLLVEKGVLSEEEIDERVATVRQQRADERKGD